VEERIELRLLLRIGDLHQQAPEPFRSSIADTGDQAF
jgi:hypothetical protein